MAIDIAKPGFARKVRGVSGYAAIANFLVGFAALMLGSALRHDSTFLIVALAVVGAVTGAAGYFQCQRPRNGIMFGPVVAADGKPMNTVEPAWMLISVAGLILALVVFFW